MLQQVLVVRRDLSQSISTLEESVEERTRASALICLLTSSIPRSSLEMATEMSSLAGSWMESAGLGFRCEEDAGGYGSPARTVLAYVLASKSGTAKMA